MHNITVPSGSPLTQTVPQGPSGNFNTSTLAQPDIYARYIRMDSDIFTTGDVIEFVVTNSGSSDLRCPNDNPGFSVVFQTGQGRWATKMGNEKPVISNASLLRPGESSKTYRFLSEGWEAGRYRIISDYGVEREFLIRSMPQPVPTTSCPVITNSTPFITIDAIPDHVAGEQFSITGKTNIAPGQELQYQIFAIVSGNTLVLLGDPVPLSVEGGTCGNNTWSARVILPEPGTYVVGITDLNRNTTALHRFIILGSLPEPSATQPINPLVMPSSTPPVPQIR